MMAVIVDDGDALDLADLGETALDAVELVEAVGDDFVRNPHLQGHADRGQRVLDIVAPRHRQAQALDEAGFAGPNAHADIKAGPTGKGSDILPPYVRMGGEAARPEQATA